MAFWVDDFPFPKVGYVNSLEGISKENMIYAHQDFMIWLNVTNFILKSDFKIDAWKFLRWNHNHPGLTWHLYYESFKVEPQTHKFHFHKVIWCYFFHWQICQSPSIFTVNANNESRVGSLRDSASHPTTSQANGGLVILFVQRIKGCCVMVEGKRWCLKGKSEVKSQVLQMEHTGNMMAWSMMWAEIEMFLNFNPTSLVIFHSETYFWTYWTILNMEVFHSFVFI